ncbi:MAG: hypothetical protein JF887_11590 [Candidatus Dormibacteraeota bacterium]|uniref:Uncharacterized protein n=1 Tax=Candidatus Amunia macphersoniae TaxID=3127014 RepID=A0A934NGJ0_9BACT|nr:hypothetical protein [Candidatus Dormibacteraeota bacterium]
MNSDSKRPRLHRRLLIAAGATAVAAGAGAAIATHSGGAASPVHLTAAPVAPGGAITTPTTPEAPETTTPESPTGVEAPGAPSDGPGGYADTNPDAQTEQTGQN